MNALEGRIAELTENELSKKSQERREIKDAPDIIKQAREQIPHRVIAPAAHEIHPSSNSINIEELHELVTAVANSTDDPNAPIHALLSKMEAEDDISDEKAQSFHKAVIELLTTEALRANPKTIAAIQKFCGSHRDTQFFQKVTLQLPDKQSVKINRILACTLSPYIESYLSRWTKDQPDIVPIQIDGYPLNGKILEAIQDYFDFGTHFRWASNPIVFFRVADYLGMDSLKQLCREELQCEGFPDLSKLAYLAMDCQDAELKVQCLEFAQEKNFQFPLSLSLPDEFKKLCEDYKAHQRISFNFPNPSLSRQKFKSYTAKEFTQARVFQHTGQAIDFCKRLGIEEIEIVNDFSNQEIGLKLKDFKSIKMPGHVVQRPNDILLQLLSSSSLVNLSLNSLVSDHLRRKNVLEKLASNTTLGSLDLANVSICLTNIDDLTSALVKNTTLQHLRLDVSGLNSQIMKKLGEALCANKGLRAIELHYFSGNLVPKQEFYEALKNRPLPLEVSSNGLDNNVRVGKGKIETFSRNSW